MNKTQTSGKASNKKSAPLVLDAPAAVIGNKVMDFAATQLTAPEAAPEAAPVLYGSLTKEEALAKALANFVPVIPKAKIPKAPRVLRIEQNGVKRPNPGTGICAQMWSMMDELSIQQGSPVSNKQIKEALPHFNQVNLQGEYASWKKFNGLSGRIADPVAE